MHVAQFVHRYPPALGGAEAWAGRLARHLVSAGHTVTVWTTTAVDLTAFTKTRCTELPAGTTTEDGVAVRRFPLSLRFPSRRYVLKAASLLPTRRWQAMVQPWGPLSLEMWRAAGRGEAELGAVHAIGFPYAAIIQSAERLARRNRVPFVITPFLHLGDPADPGDPIRRAYTAPHLRRMLREADRVIVQTPTEAGAVAEIGVPGAQIVLQGLGVDPTECIGGNREQARARWGILPDEVLVGHLANMSLEKGTPDMLAAMEIARGRGINLRALLAGPTMPSLRWYWKFGTEDWITNLGPISDADRRDFFAAIDLFALPSRSDSFGLVFLEAWANSVPVVGYRAGGVADVIRHEKDGLLVRCGDMEGLAEAVRRLAIDPAVRREWGRAGQDRLAREFRWDDKLGIATVALTKWG
jgi:glycosyltransferase involved in cell wall biosynthesis